MEITARNLKSSFFDSIEEAIPTEVTTTENRTAKAIDAIKYKINRLFDLYENDETSKKVFTERLALLTSKQYNNN